MELCGGIPVSIPLKAENKFRLTKEELEEKITDKTKVLLISFPNNPTGAIMEKEDLEAIREVVTAHDIFVKEFIVSEEDVREKNDAIAFAVEIDSELEYVLVIFCPYTSENLVIGRMAVCQLRTLVLGESERYDRNNFIQNILLGNMLGSDIINRAKKLHIENRKRVVYVIDTGKNSNEIAVELVKNLADIRSGDFVVAMDEHNVVLVKDVFLFLSVGLVAINLILMEFMQNTIEKEERIKIAVLTEQNQKNRIADYQDREEIYERQRRKMHDYKNQLSTIQTLIKNGHTDEALSFTQKLTESIAVEMSAINTNHPVVNAVLNQKHRSMQEKHIAVILKVGDLQEICLEEEEIVILLSNLLDNAIRESEKVLKNTGKAVIHLKLECEDHKLIFAVRNPVTEKVEIENDTIKSKRGEHHGIEDISGALLLHVDGFGDVRLSDVADVQIIDNAEESFTRLNGERSVVLKIFKSNSSSAGEVSGNCKAAFKELEQKYDGLHVVVLSNQGNYISIIVSSILSSMLIGAALAIIVLAIFLKDIKPTLVVGISIPLSVLFAVVLMYFTGLDMNIMTLAGLSLGIGMLVDNSIVVIENIYRLRSRGVPAARAAVQGTKQVGMAIMASTLTSVCVFLPVIFTSGVIKSLLQPMSMCIGYCLAASLIVALTVAPAASSTLLKNSKPKELKWFDKVQEKYVKSLEWCFQHRWAPLGAAVVLLVFCGWRVMSMGVEMLPTITSNEAIVTLSTEKDMTKEESYAVAENVIDALLAVDNVEEVGVTTDSRVAGMDVGQLGLPQTITDLLNAANSYGTYQINVMLDESLSSRQIEQAREALEEAVNGVENCTATVEISGMQELTSQLDMGLTVQVSGNDIDTMTALSEKVVDMVNEMDGFTNATNGLGSGDATINLKH